LKQAVRRAVIDVDLVVVVDIDDVAVDVDPVVFVADVDVVDVVYGMYQVNVVGVISSDSRR